MTELTNNIKNNNNIDNDGKLHSLVDDRTKYDEIFAAVFETLRTLENNPNKFIDKTIKKEGYFFRNFYFLFICITIFCIVVRCPNRQ